MASAIQTAPSFTSRALQDKTHGWICYGPKNTVLPHIVDLKDTKFEGVEVNLGALSSEQLELFLAIEEPEADARKGIKPDARRKYFPTVPFQGWTLNKSEADLPMFGTIGWMYQCYWDYLNLAYDDGTSLFDEVFKVGSIQNDMFNPEGQGHPAKEYPGFSPTLAGVSASAALSQINAMLSAITDQGEGSLLPDPSPPMLAAVEQKYRADKANLEQDYPGATDTGQSAPSADAAARADNDGPDHYERFCDLATWVGEVQTWPQRFGGGKRWAAADMQASDYDPIANPYTLPTTQEVADSINRMAYPPKRTDHDKNYTLFTQAAVGALAGVTSVLQ